MRKWKKWLLKKLLYQVSIKREVRILKLKN